VMEKSRFIERENETYGNKPKLDKEKFEGFK
jgi:hypothetical protein